MEVDLCVHCGTVRQVHQVSKPGVTVWYCDYCGNSTDVDYDDTDGFADSVADTNPEARDE